MKTFSKHATALSAVCLSLALHPMAYAQGTRIAEMDLDGSNGFIDNAKQKPSGRDLPIRDGNMVRTGQRTSAFIEIIPQGAVQLNENSAKLITDSFFKGAKCFAVKLIAGELFINGENVCFVTNVGAVSGISRSQIDIKVDKGRTVITVLEGAADLEKPAPMRVNALEQLVVLPNGEFHKTSVDQATAQRTIDWARSYDFTHEQKKGMSPALKALLVALGFAVGAAIVNDHHDGGGSPPPPPPADPQPTTDPARPPDAPPPPSPTPQSTDVLRPAPVLVQSCCIGGLNGTTLQLTPEQCSARGGDAGACTVVK